MNEHIDFASGAVQIRAAANHIVEAIENRLATKQNDNAPLFVVIGETHLDYAHEIFQELLVKLLSKKGYGIALGQELPHNHFSREINKDNISISYNDLARKSTGLYKYRDMIIELSRLDETDPFTKKCIIDALGQNHPERISTITADGMHIRNIGIVKNALSHAESIPCEVYIQSCGKIHVGGSRSHSINFPYEQSLTAIFNDHKASVLGVTLDAANSMDGYDRPDSILDIHLPDVSLVDRWHVKTRLGLIEQDPIEKLISAIETGYRKMKSALKPTHPAPR